MTRTYKKYKVRINLIIASAIFSWLCLSIRLFQIQILNGAEYKSAVLLQSQIKHVKIPERGNFFDRDNRPLSRNVFHYTLSTNPKQVNDKIGLAREISAIADKDKVVILAEAYKQSEQLRGEGDATAASIYAESFSQDPEFYEFTRSMKAYVETFENKSDVMLIDSDSEFFKYLNNKNKANKD